MSCLPIRGPTVVLSLLWASSAWGGGRDVLLVGQLPADTRATIREELSRRGVTAKQLQSHYPVSSEMRDRDQATITRVEATTRTAEERYYRIELEMMLASLTSELVRSSAALVAMGRWDLLRTLLLWQGVGFARSGRQQEALSSFAAAIAAGAPPPEAGRFPPAVLAMYTRASQQVSARSKSELTLKISPEAATIEIDGRKITERRPSLTTGLHWVRARAIGFVTIVKQVTMSSETKQLALSLEPASVSEIARQVAAAREAGTLDATRPHVAAALGRLAGTDEVLVVQQRDQSTAGKLVSYSRIRSADGTLLGRQAELVDKDKQRSVARRAIARLWPQAVAIDAGGARKKKRSRPFYTKWWFWTVVGVAAVAGGTAAILATADWNDSYRINLSRP